MGSNNSNKGYSSYFKHIIEVGPPILEKYINYISGIQGVALSTAANYYRDLILFFEFILVSRGKEYDFSGLVPESMYDVIVKTLSEDINEVLVHSIRREDVICFLQHLKIDNENHAEARNRRLAALRSFFNFAEVELNIIDYNPTAHIPVARKDKPLPKYLTLEQSKKLLDSVPHHKFYIRDYCMLVFFLNFGLRISELVSINISDIDNGKIRIRGKGSKERVLYFNNISADAYSKYLDARLSMPYIKKDSRDALFVSERGTRISVRRVNDVVHECFNRAGFKNEGFTPHKLRHTAATLMYQHGNVDIRALKDFLGHESIGTTQIYTHTNNELIKEAVAKNPLANFNKKENEP